MIQWFSNRGSDRNLIQLSHVQAAFVKMESKKKTLINSSRNKWHLPHCATLHIVQVSGLRSLTGVCTKAACH